jgi:hypothetical protein
LIFGLLHFDVLIDFTDPMQVAQNIMKVVQTGMCGFIFAAILVKTCNIWTVIVIHAANDFMLLFMTSALKAEEVSTQYVMTGDEGVAVLVVYCVICVLYTPLIVVGKRLIDEVGPWRGDFYPYEKARQAAMLQDATPAEPIPAAAPAAPVAEIALAEAAHPVLAAEIPQIGATIPRHAAPGALQNLEPGAPTDETDAEALAKAMRGKHAAPRHARQEGTTDGQSL